MNRNIKLLAVANEFISDDISNVFEILNVLNGNQPSLIYSKLQKKFTPKLKKTEEWMDHYSNLQFFHIFRMTKETFNEFLSAVVAEGGHLLCKKYSGGYTPIQIQLYVFLWYMATQDSLLYIGDRFKLCPATVMSIVNKILFVMLKLKKKMIPFPKTEQDMLAINQNFQTYPGSVGALDGTHIFVKVPKDQQDSYIDRYRRHSINVMAVCTAAKLFTYVFIGFPGSAHDSRVFENSQLFLNISRYGTNSIFIDDEKYHIIGDSAFGLRKWLMTPYNGSNLSRKERHHNYRLSSSRVAIEHAFGLLKGRWRRLQFINTYNICKTVEIATAGCVLHNFCILNGDIWEEEYRDHYRFEDGEERIVEDAEEGRQKRNNIANLLFN